MGEMFGLKRIGSSDSLSRKERLVGRRYPDHRRVQGALTALYLRVSTPDQKPDLQYDGLHGYAARAGLEVIRDYCDVAVSGRREGRPQLNALMTAVRNREIDCVLVWKFDRFARSTRHLLAALEEFDHLGVRFVSVQDQVDTDSPMGRQWHGALSARSKRSPPRPTSASAKSRRKSQAGRAAVSSARSPNASAPHRGPPCDHFLHVSSTYPM
jgi:hypothetical protein